MGHQLRSICLLFSPRIFKGLPTLYRYSVSRSIFAGHRTVQIISSPPKSLLSAANFIFAPRESRMKRGAAVFCATMIRSLLYLLPSSSSSISMLRRIFQPQLLPLKRLCTYLFACPYFLAVVLWNFANTWHSFLVYPTVFHHGSLIWSEKQHLLQYGFW